MKTMSIGFNNSNETLMLIGGFIHLAANNLLPFQMVVKLRRISEKGIIESNTKSNFCMEDA